MNTQPEALRLAERLERYNAERSGYGKHCHKAAAELRRLQCERDELLKVLVSFTKSEYIRHQHPRRFAAAAAAIAKAEGKK